MSHLTLPCSNALAFAPFGKGGGRPQSGRRGICSSREKQIPHKPLPRLVAPFSKGGYLACLPAAVTRTVH
jgi:hypothetical protein